MAKLRDVVAYLAKHYPHKSELSKARLTKMVYLADWRYSILNDKQVSPIEWVYDHYGPYVDDVINVAHSDPDFTVEKTSTMYGDPKDLISVCSETRFDSLTPEEYKVLDFVIDTVASKTWNDFIRLVYSTYPIVTQARHTKLNLVKLAKKYKEHRALSSAD